MRAGNVAVSSSLERSTHASAQIFAGSDPRRRANGADSGRLGEHRRVAVEREAGAAGDLHVEELADVAFAALEDDDFVRAGSAHEAVGVGFARAFAQNLDARADKRVVFTLRDF